MKFTHTHTRAYTASQLLREKWLFFVVTRISSMDINVKVNALFLKPNLLIIRVFTYWVHISKGNALISSKKFQLTFLILLFRYEIERGGVNDDCVLIFFVFFFFITPNAWRWNTSKFPNRNNNHSKKAYRCEYGIFTMMKKRKRWHVIIIAATI